ncbi:MAG: D-glycero-D-manno-heptose 1,7-bisphosphate phosphatase [Gammaproteobacteria bacterium]
MVRLLILDRDGVINEESAQFIKSPAEWKPISGSLEAIANAYQFGFTIVVVSNQSGLSRGLFNIDQLNKIHALMIAEVAKLGGRIEAVFFCPHGPDDGCQCRKPNPGLLLNVGERLNVNLKQATFIGDRASDIEAGKSVGAKMVLVETGRGTDTKASLQPDSDLLICKDLAEAVDWARRLS